MGTHQGRGQLLYRVSGELCPESYFSDCSFMFRVSEIMTWLWLVQFRIPSLAGRCSKAVEMLDVLQPRFHSSALWLQSCEVGSCEWPYGWWELNQVLLKNSQPSAISSVLLVCPSHLFRKHLEINVYPVWITFKLLGGISSISLLPIPSSDDKLKTPWR